MPGTAKVCKDWVDAVVNTAGVSDGAITNDSTMLPRVTVVDDMIIPLKNGFIVA